MRLKTLLYPVFLFLIIGIVSCFRITDESRTVKTPHTPSLSDRYIAGAYYYLWYPKNIEQGVFRQTLVPAQEPKLGWYDSSDVSVIEQHIDWCAEYGIQFLALNFWPGKPEQNRLIDEAFLKAKNIHDIQFCIFYESWCLGFDSATGYTPFDKKNISLLIQDMEYLADHYFNHPSYFKIDNRPVVILYLTRTFTGEFKNALLEARKTARRKGFDLFLIGDEIFWKVAPVPSLRNAFSSRMTETPQQERIRLFDAVTGYNLYESAKPAHRGYPLESTFVAEGQALLQSYQKKCAPGVRLFPGVIPGYNDRGTRPNENHFAIPRKSSAEEKEGSTFELLLNQWFFPLLDPEIPVFLITSFNEWNEDTGIEPLKPCPPTSKDIGKPEGFFTEGYPYAGFDVTYLELLRNKTVALTGRITDHGTPLQGIEVTAYQENKPVAMDLTDSKGRYLLSRLNLKQGKCTLKIANHFIPVPVLIHPGKTSVLDWNPENNYSNK